MADFASEYGIRLAPKRFVAWREFYPLLVGLLACDSRLARHFAPALEKT